MLLKPKYVGRFRHVATVLVRHGFADVLGALDLLRFLPGHRHERTTPAEREAQRARGLRTALEELGATYIKLGQVLSTRPDILPAAYIEALEELQDRVEPFDFAAVRRTTEEELGRPLEEIFSRFEPVPVASASLSQVHRAELAAATPGGGPAPAPIEVAVKVLRPGVEEEVRTDLEILGEVARFVARTVLGRRYDFVAIVAELQRTLTEELDLTREARNAEHFRRVFANRPRLRVPAVFPAVTTPRLYVAEYVDGVRLNDLPDDRRAPEVAEELWRAYLHEILVGGLFQCDPHPGNFLVGADGRMALLDHGMVAHLSRETQGHLMMLLLALGDGDGEAAAEACIEIGLPGADFHERRFRGEIGLMVARYGGRRVGELDLGRVVLELLRTAYRNDIEIPSELMLFGKTLLNLEGVCRKLDPAMDPVAIMRQVAGPLLREQLTRQVTRRRAIATALEARSALTQIPAGLRRLIRRAAANELRVGLKIEGADQLGQSVQKIASRVSLGLITAALIIGSALVLNVQAGLRLWGYPVFALVGFLLAAGLGIYLVVKIILLDKY